MASPSRRRSPYLSQRATENITEADHWKPIVDALSDGWSASNPHGVVALGIAENSILHDEIAAHMKAHFDIDPHTQLTYGSGPQGSLRLRTALASFFNDRLRPLVPVESGEFVITSGVSGLMDSLTWCLCDEGEGLLCPRPVYTGFSNDIPTRSRGTLVGVSFQEEDGSYNLDAVFDAEANVRALEQALRESEAKGVKTRAVIITNPHNPLGKCYPVETIKAIAAFCSRHNLHYLSDEIYANSVFENPNAPDATRFTSVLAVDFDGSIDTNLVHVMYGAAKDFCANGLRIGALHTRSQDLLRAVNSITTFGWQAYIVQDMWARVLEDKTFLAGFMDENQRRLAKHYGILTDFLDQHGIPYYRGGNAGIFLWVNLSRYIDDSNHPADGIPSTAKGVEKYIVREAEFATLCQKNGVWVGRGSNFLADRIGWFRVTFTAKEEALKEGLRRIWESLEQFNASSIPR